MKRRLIAPILSIFLLGCGGGGDDGATTTTELTSLNLLTPSSTIPLEVVKGEDSIYSFSVESTDQTSPSNYSLTISGENADLFTLQKSSYDPNIWILKFKDPSKATENSTYKVTLLLEKDGQSQTKDISIKILPSYNENHQDSDLDYIPDSIEDYLGLDKNSNDQNGNNILDGNESDNSSASFRDLFFYNQWHIQSIRGRLTKDDKAPASGNDLGLMKVYKNHGVMGFNGNNRIIVQVVDTGVDIYHEDLEANIDRSRSYDKDEIGNPEPDYDRDDAAHGTKVAGIIAARAFNKVGVRGVAPFAKIAASNWISDQSISTLEKLFFSGSGMEDVAVTNCSWGSYFNNETIYDELMEKGTKYLRDGKGRIYVFAAGNDRSNNADANIQYMINNQYAIAVAALKDTNVVASYSTPGANILVSAYGGSINNNEPSIGTTTIEGWGGSYTWSADTQKNYSYNMIGTSAAAPMVSGEVALLLEACPNLTWRDVKYLIAKNATQVDSSNSSWIRNGAGYHFSRDYGFGLINLDGMINECKSGYSLLPSQTTTQNSISPNQTIRDLETKTFNINISNNLKIEWVELTVDSSTPSASDLDIYLTSPSGTKILMVKNGTEVSGGWMDGGFRFSTPGFLDESSNGNWTITIKDNNYNQKYGTIRNISLKVYGH